MSGGMTPVPLYEGGQRMSDYPNDAGLSQQ